MVDLDSSDTQGNACARKRTEMRRAQRCLLVLCATAGLVSIACRRGGGEVAPPTGQEARQFIEAAEKRLEALGKKAARAGWVQDISASARPSILTVLFLKSISSIFPAISMAASSLSNSSI